MPKILKKNDFVSLLPSNATPLERALERSIYRCTNLEASIEYLWNPYTGNERGFSVAEARSDFCPESCLSFLAWSLGIEIWNSSWTEEEKRKIIKKYLYIRKIRGTLKALKMAYEALGVRLEVKEWWEEGVSEKAKAPFFFEVKLFVRANSNLVTEENRDRIRWITDRLKPLRAAYDLNIIFTMEAVLGLAMTTKLTKICRLTGELCVA